MLRRAKHTAKERAPNGVIALAVVAFVLSAVPKMNIRVGPAPLYLIDLLIILAALYAVQRPGFGPRGRPFSLIVIILFLYAIAGEIVGLAYTGALFDHVYWAFRMSMAFLLFYSVGQLVRSERDLELVLKGLALGLIVTASIMILTSLPMTRPLVTSLVLENTLLDPAGKRSAARYINLDEDSGVRGRTLVGVSILGASFINIVWPLVAILLAWTRPIGIWRNIAMIACFLAPMGVLMSYSRGPIIGSILIILACLLIGLRHIRKGVLLPLVAGVALVGLVGVQSEVFFFDRLVKSTTTAIESPFEHERETERILAYVEPFGHVMEKPFFFLAGQGVAINRAVHVRPEMAGQATHALFAMAYYSQGLVAAFLYMFLILSMFFLAIRHASKRVWGAGAMLSHALVGSALGILPWAVFGHAIVSQPRGAMMFFFILGLMAALRHFPLVATPPRYQTTARVAHGHSASAPV